MKKRKICVITGTRAEYGLLSRLIMELSQDGELDFQLIVTGMHLSPEFGQTVKEIESDGIQINKKLEILLSSDSSIGISKSIGLGVISFSEAFEDLQPDVIVVLGDRFEILAACISAMIANIPIAHIHGGEATEGLIDEPIRHSITKMSHFHFAATEKYRNRIIQLGESPERVFNYGTPALDNIEELPLLDREALISKLNFPFNKNSAVVTFHPVTLDKGSAKQQFENLLRAIQKFPSLNLIFTKPNADTDGRVIIELIDGFVKENPQHKAFTSLGRLVYLSTLSQVDLVIGNSSSGLIEAPSFKIPTVNIGDRQDGRIKAESVIDCLPDTDAISESISFALSDDFQQKSSSVENPYGQPGASKKIATELKRVNLSGVLKKRFFDIEFSL